MFCLNLWDDRPATHCNAQSHAGSVVQVEIALLLCHLSGLVKSNNCALLALEKHSRARVAHYCRPTAIERDHQHVAEVVCR